MKDYTTFVAAVVTMLSAIITTFVIPWIKAKTSAEQLQKIMEWVTIAVDAAEQIYAGAGRGTEKKQYVIEFLASRGITVDDEALDALIESEVYKLNKELTA
ncbi:MAG: phage holin, LLH family [Clostridiaceae bacterium]|nr:phage holin, LLH family [Clostridiaceae bacterium]